MTSKRPTILCLQKKQILGQNGHLLPQTRVISSRAPRSPCAPPNFGPGSSTGGVWKFTYSHNRIFTATMDKQQNHGSKESV